MAFWLAPVGAAQVHAPLKRFDPRYWTVVFPRPMMAAVTTSGADTLRVDAVFYRRNDLAGLVWEAEDRHDHPLLRYEALALIDGAMHACAETICAVPPADLAAGTGFLVSANPGGVFAGHANELAVFTKGGWRFVEPREGFAVWVRDQGVAMRWCDGAWSGAQTCSELRVNGQQVVGARAPAVASPSGGTVIDAEARAAIASLIATLKSHGLID